MAVIKKEKVKMRMILIWVNILLVTLFVMMLLPVSVDAGIGENNVTVLTNLTVGNVYPEILNVSINDDAASFSLTPNATTLLSCIVRVRDFNGDTDISNVNATLYDTVISSPNGGDDNNFHYTNSSCEINLTGEWGGHSDTLYTAVANCTFEVEYYANPQTWNCSATVVDNSSWEYNLEDSILFNDLLALGLPDIIQYGTVNATEVSAENITNVTNYGNILVNLSLSGYAQSEGDNLAMNCTLGNIGTIPIYYEKYNLTNTNPGVLTLSGMEAGYANLTSSPTVREFNLNYRQADGFNDAINASYWRVYVPMGVAGTCQGNIIFGAVEAPGVAYS